MRKLITLSQKCSMRRASPAKKRSIQRGAPKPEYVHSGQFRSIPLKSDFLDRFSFFPKGRKLSSRRLPREGSGFDCKMLVVHVFTIILFCTGLVSLHGARSTTRRGQQDHSGPGGRGNRLDMFRGYVGSREHGALPVTSISTTVFEVQNAMPSKESLARGHTPNAKPAASCTRCPTHANFKPQVWSPNGTNWGQSSEIDLGLRQTGVWNKQIRIWSSCLTNPAPPPRSQPPLDPTNSATRLATWTSASLARRTPASVRNFNAMGQTLPSLAYKHPTLCILRSKQLKRLVGPRDVPTQIHSFQVHDDRRIPIKLVTYT